MKLKLKLKCAGCGAVIGSRWQKLAHWKRMELWNEMGKMRLKKNRRSRSRRDFEMSLLKLAGGAVIDRIDFKMCGGGSRVKENEM